MRQDPLYSDLGAIFRGIILLRARYCPTELKGRASPHAEHTSSINPESIGLFSKQTGSNLKSNGRFKSAGFEIHDLTKK